jgi:hypothetical protein
METKAKGRGPLLRRGKMMIATLAALTAMAGAVQAIAPTSAVALRSQCAPLYNAAQSAYKKFDFATGDYLMARWAECEEKAEREEGPGGP